MFFFSIMARKWFTESSTCCVNQTTFSLFFRLDAKIEKSDDKTECCIFSGLRCRTTSTDSVRETEMCFLPTSLRWCRAASSKYPCLYPAYPLELIFLGCNDPTRLVPPHSDFIRSLFPEALNTDKKGRPTTASSKIKVRVWISDTSRPKTPLICLEDCVVLTPFYYPLSWTTITNYFRSSQGVLDGSSVVLLNISVLSGVMVCFWFCITEASERAGGHADEMHSALYPLHQTQRDQEAQRLGGEPVSLRASPAHPGPREIVG